MKIGIDISQIVYEGTGVAHYVRRMVEELLKIDRKNEYILFGASLRQQYKFYQYFQSLRKIPGIEKINSGNLFSRIRLVVVPIPPTFLDILWNRLHILPIEWFIGRVNVFWSSDWTQPPLKHARGVTTIHDLSFLRYPKTFAKQIITVQKRRFSQARKECRMFLCDSHATAQDVEKFLGISKDRLRVIYPGITLYKGSTLACKG